MTICGIDIKGSEAIFALATQGPDGLQHLAIASKKIVLDDDENALNVKAFAAQLAAFVKANGITRIAIKKRSKKGEFAGGPTTFKSKASSSCWTIARCNCCHRKPSTRNSKSTPSSCPLH